MKMRKKLGDESIRKFYLHDKIADIDSLLFIDDLEKIEGTDDLMFAGYRTCGNPVGRLWNNPIEVSVRIIPDANSEKPCGAISTWGIDFDDMLMDDDKAYISSLLAKAERIGESIPPHPDEKMERQYRYALDIDGFNESFEALEEINRSYDRSFEEKCRMAQQHIARLCEVLSDVHLPEELMRDDTVFAARLSELRRIAQVLSKSAPKNDETLKSQATMLFEILERAVSEMQNATLRMFEIERRMTAQELETHKQMLAESRSEALSIEQRIEILEKICDNPLVRPDEKLECISEIVTLIKRRAKERFGDNVPSPDKALIERHLASIAKAVEALDVNHDVWCKRVVEETIIPINECRGNNDREYLSKEHLLTTLFAERMEVVSKEQNGTSECKIDIYLSDKDRSLPGEIKLTTIGLDIERTRVTI